MAPTDDDFESNVRAAAEKALADFRKKNKIPTILLCGKTGAGKSSILNALVGAAVQEVGVVPTTLNPKVAQLDDSELSIRAIDVAGFGEADMHEQRMAVMMQQLAICHIILVVVGFPDRGLEWEVEFLQAVQTKLGSPDRMVPVVGAANKIDLAPPPREWNPQTLNLENPKTEKEESIRRWSLYVTNSLQKIVPLRFIECAAGEFWNDRERQYGIEDLRWAVYEALPEAVRTMFARIVHNEALRERRAQSIILGATSSAVLAGAQPLPGIPDATIIAPIQISMIVALAVLHGADPTALVGIKLVGPVLATMGGRLAFQQLIKLIPGVGSVLGAGIAGLITLSLGQAYHYLMKKGVWNPSKEEILAAFNSFYEKNRDIDLNKLRRRG